MTSEEEFINTFAAACGIELRPDTDGLYDLSVDDRSVVLRHEDPGDVWVLMTPIVLEWDKAPTPPVLRKALELNLMGSGTNGATLGLLGDAFMLSLRVPGEGLAADAFAERLHLLAQTANAVVQELEHVQDDVSSASNSSTIQNPEAVYV